MKRLAKLFIAALLVAPALAAAQPRPIELSPPVPVEVPAGKVEIVEFFWYGCIHCYNLEPALEGWLKKLPSDAQFRRVPAIFSERWAHDAAIFYTFEAMGLLDKLHRPFFDAIHRDRLRTDNPAALNEWLQKRGVDAKKFGETMKSFGVQSKTRRAAQLTNAYKIDGTPAMAVQGRYVIGAGDGMLDSVSRAIELARKPK